MVFRCSFSLPFFFPVALRSIGITRFLCYYGDSDCLVVTLAHVPVREALFL